MMELRERLKKKQNHEIWHHYCGFLDLDMKEYMTIQNRLMGEQIRLWSESALGQSILRGKHPQNLDEFREMVPLTTYDDYADILLQKRPEALPGEPIIWIQTTWEGGKHPIKVAPYTRSMLDTYRTNVIACMLLATSEQKGDFKLENTDKMLYGLAPLPYATGILPLLLKEEADIQFLPAVKDAVNMSFSQRNKEGFKLAMKQDVELFFGVGSVAYAVSTSLAAMTKSGGGAMKAADILQYKPNMLARVMKAKKLCKDENRDLLPKDLFHLKGLMIAGTDNQCYKDDLEKMWGIRPMELFAGTEPSLLGCESWTRNGLYFFPDAAFYEFIQYDDMIRNYEDPSYIPRTVLMNEVEEGKTYELVFTILKGGAFARYRCGDMYRCVGLSNREDETRIPRFQFVDRVPWIIDIAGFTRISENGIRNAITLSHLPIEDWVALKEYNDENRPYMRLYVELKEEGVMSEVMSAEILKDVLGTYFKYLDQDYRDLQKLLGMDPLVITILRCGTFATYESRNGKRPRHMTPSAYEIADLVGAQDLRKPGMRSVYTR